MAHGSSYWALYHAARARFNLTPAEARTFRALFPFPYAIDLRRHPRIAQRVADEARRRHLREDSEEWEVTIHYSTAEQMLDVTVRILAPSRSTKEQVKKAFWRFVNQRASTYYRLLGTVDWRREAAGKVYPGSGEQASLADFKSLFFHAQIRVAPVET